MKVSAYMKKVDGIWWTNVIVSGTEKRDKNTWEPTPESQIPEERESQLFKPEPVAVIGGQHLVPFNKRNGI